MRKVYCYAEKEEKPEEIDHSGDIVKDLSSFDISDIKNRSFFFIGGEIIENPYYEPSEYMKRVYESIDAQYEKFYRSDNDKKDSENEDDVRDAETETNEQSPDDEMPDWIAEMPYGELIKRFPGGISEALEYAKKEKGLSVPEVHYDSSEPEKLGVKAFTKNAEVYLAPGEGEETLKHELGHVIQQKNEKIPATTKIGEQQVNLDPKLEQEADEFAEHIEDHIPKIISNESTNTETKNIVQFAPISDEDLRKKILEEARNLAIPNMHTLIALKLDDIVKEFRKKESDTGKYLKSWYWPNKWSDYFKSYVRICITEVLEEIRKPANFEDTPDYNLYGALDESKTPGSEQENKRITEIMDMLSTEKIFIGESGQKDATLHNVLSILTEDQQESVKNSILKLKVCCDAEGVKSVLEGASKNVSHDIINLENFNDWTTTMPESVSNLKEVFIKRLMLMTDYIEDVYKNKEYHGEKIGKNYWIRSTGSDPHKNGEHALFLVGKRSGKIERVYKPHDLAPDAAVLGEHGMFYELNDQIDTNGSFLGGRPALAIMSIDPESHTEELINPKREMTIREAEEYFFRAGILDVITRAMAVIDLHCDNIMPTENGPIIIDAEVDFMDYSNSGLVEGSGTNALGTDEIQLGMADSPRPTNSTFEIVEDSKNIKSGMAFSDKTSVYYSRYKAGYNFMLKQLKDNKEHFAEIYRSKLQSLDKIRILPISTKDLAGDLQDAIMQRYSEKNLAIVLNKTVANIKNALETKVNFIFNMPENNLEANINEEDLKQAVETTFRNGTIISMYIDMNGKIYLDDKEIGYIFIPRKCWCGCIMKDLTTTDEIIKVMQDSFLKVIDELNVIN